MNLYQIKSPSGKTYSVIASSIYHAVQIIVDKEEHKYSNGEYLKINK